MRLQAALRLRLPHEAIPREASIWQRIRGAFGARVDLDGDRGRPLLQAIAIVDQGRTALKRLGITNAVSLVVDDTVLYSDVDGKQDDLGDLVLAMSEYSPVVSSSFRYIRFAVEHEEAGLHFVVETHAVGEHPIEEPAATIHVGARVVDLEAKLGETAEAYRERVTRLIAREGWLDGCRRQFEAFVARLGDSFRAAFPEGQLAEEGVVAKVVRPADGAPSPRHLGPGHPGYDPHAYYYPSPLEPMLSGLMLSMFLTSAFHPPFIHVVHPSGAPIAPADQLAEHAGELSPEAADPGVEAAAAGGEHGGGDEAGGDGDLGGDDFDGDLGDAGDFGGGDFGDL